MVPRAVQEPINVGLHAEAPLNASINALALLRLLPPPTDKSTDAELTPDGREKEYQTS